MVSPGSLLLTFLIGALVFGTKRLRSLGEDLGAAFKGFKRGLQEGHEETSSTTTTTKSEDSHH